MSLIKKSLLFLLISSACAYSQNTNPEDLYKKGDYENAAQIYLGKINSNPHDYASYYNYANCMYRIGNIPEALAYYMKAFSINPRNSNIFFNLSYVSKQAGSPLFPDDVPTFVYRLYFLLSINEIKALLNVSFWIFCLSTSIILLGRSTNLFKNVAYSSLFICVFMALLFFFRTNSAFYSSAVVKSGQTRIMSGPGEDFKLIAMSDSGKIVKILSESGDWIEVGLHEQGIKGWIKADQIIKI